MSGLADFAAVYTTVKALRGQTYAGDNVLQTPGGTITVTSPTIAVFGGHGHFQPMGRDLSGADGKLIMRIELFCPAETTATSGASTYHFDNIATPDPILAFMWRQCQRALLSNVTVWSRLWHQFVLGVEKGEFRSELYETETGEKLLCRMIEFDCSVLSEPDFGSPAQGAWANLLTAMRADTAETAALADMLQAEIEDPAGTFSWQIAAAAIGASRGELRGIGLGPLDYTLTQDVVVEHSAILEDETEETELTISVSDPIWSDP